MKKMIYDYKRATEILDEDNIDGYDYRIVSYGTHPCCYVKVPDDSRYSKIDDCDDLNDFAHVHGGFTYKDKNWFGWDYNHLNDYYDGILSSVGSKRYSTEQLLEDVKRCIKELKENA